MELQIKGLLNNIEKPSIERKESVTTYSEFLNPLINSIEG
jgi:hypothetical protein